MLIFILEYYVHIFTFIYSYIQIHIQIFKYSNILKYTQIYSNIFTYIHIYSNRFRYWFRQASITMIVLIREENDDDDVCVWWYVPTHAATSRTTRHANVPQTIGIILRTGQDVQSRGRELDGCHFAQDLPQCTYTQSTQEIPKTNRPVLRATYDEISMRIKRHVRHTGIMTWIMR